MKDEIWITLRLWHVQGVVTNGGGQLKRREPIGSIPGSRTLVGGTRSTGTKPEPSVDLV